MQHQPSTKPLRKKLKASFHSNSVLSVDDSGASLCYATLPVDTTSHGEQYRWRPKSLICQNMQKNSQALALEPREPTMASNTYDNDTESDSEEDAVISEESHVGPCVQESYTKQKNMPTAVPVVVLPADVATVEKPPRRTVKYTFVVGSDVRKGKCVFFTTLYT